MSYQGIVLQDAFTVERLYSVHYFEYMNDFIFPGETHDFWEFVCVDKGEVNILADTRHYSLSRGEVFFHRPNEFHAIRANGVSAPNLVVISFRCTSPLMDFFSRQRFTINETERELLSAIIVESRSAFASRLDDPYLENLERREPPDPMAEQLIVLHLEEFLISLFRRYKKSRPFYEPQKTSHVSEDTRRFDSIVDYMEKHISEQLTVAKICEDNLLSRSQLQKLFSSKCQAGAIAFFSKMKIDAAKQMIREQELNFTQIAEALGYTSVHYFSRQFKKIAGMSPSEYASSIKMLSEAHLDEGKYPVSRPSVRPLP